MLKLPGHSRYGYVPITKRQDYTWPGGKRLAFYIALNIEHFALERVLVWTRYAAGFRRRATGHGAITAIESGIGGC